MSLKLSNATNTSSPEFVAWVSAVWKANDIRNQLQAQLALCEQLKEKLG